MVLVIWALKSPIIRRLLFANNYSFINCSLFVIRRINAKPNSYIVLCRYIRLICLNFSRLDLLTEVESHPDQFFRGKARAMYNSNLKRVADFLGLNILIKFHEIIRQSKIFLGFFSSSRFFTWKCRVFEQSYNCNQYSHE